MMLEAIWRFEMIVYWEPIWEVRTRYWKLREGENRLSVLLEGIPHVVERAVTRPRRPRVSRGLDLSKMLSEP
ncbi:hypothetical protein GQ457_06G020810 [Hibiscus cannabinus]